MHLNTMHCMYTLTLFGKQKNEQLIMKVVCLSVSNPEYLFGNGDTRITTLLFSDNFLKKPDLHLLRFPAGRVI